MDSIIETVKKWSDFRGEYRNQWSSILSGILFFIGWWIIIDVAVIYKSEEEFKGTFYICGVLATVSLIMINTVKNEQISGDYYSDGCCGPQTARLWLLCGFVMGFSAVIASFWIFIQYFIAEKKESLYPGVALFLQNGLIFGSAVILKYGRVDDQ